MAEHSAPSGNFVVEPTLLDATGSLSHDERGGKYLIFRLGHGEFGARVQKVREVIRMQGITWVPNAPPFIAGVINLRGQVIPVVDLRLTFGLQAVAKTPETCIVVLRVTLGSVQQVLGVIVDAVLEVLHVDGTDFLEAEELQAAAEPGIREPAPYLVGVARGGGRLKLLLDVDEVLNHLDLRQVPILSAAA